MQALRKLNPPLRILLATLWAGSIWALGYIAAPTLFERLPDRMQAGTIAGYLFQAGSLVSMACGFVLFSLLLSARDMVSRQWKTCMLLVLAMLAITLVGYFVLQPMMSDLRAAAGASGVLNGEGRARFGMLHGISSSLHLLQSLLAVWLVLRIR